jgi:LmbE family N-acetylglucosaminyl deacetylase
MVLEDSEIERILVVTAHPDDVDFGAAGTVASWTAKGFEVSYCIVTDGGAGNADPTIPRTEVPALRRAEQVAAAREVGVSDVRFLGYLDGELYVTHGLRRDIVRVIRQVRPQRMLIQSPERNWERLGASHPDHLAAAEAAVQAIYPDARNPHAHTELLDDEGLEPWTVREAWLMADARPNHWVDITAHSGAKFAALRAHRSQTSHMEDLEGMLTTWMSSAAQTARDNGHDLPEGALVEAFRVVSTG